MKSRGGSIKFYVCVWIIVWRPGGKGCVFSAKKGKCV